MRAVALPRDRRFLEDLKCVTAFAPDYQKMPFERFARCRDYEDYCRTVPMALNLAELVGHNTLRASVMGVADRAPTGAELALMKDRLRAGMEQGALGLSSGLIYIPGVYCTTEEVIELCRVIRPYGGIYANHMRNEAADVVKSVKEAIFIAESAGVPLVISHHKVCGRDNWGASWETLRLIEEAAARGVKIGLDQYPYEANMTALNVCIPPRHFAQGIPALLEKLQDPSGRAQIAAEMNDPAGGLASGMGTCGLVGQIGVYAGWVNDVAEGAKAAITPMDWVGLILISFVLPAILCPLFGLFFRKIGWIREGDLKLQ